ncbi:hypothetical protein HNP52_000359 [Sphingomonas kyeonggiensis]|uniref:DUF4398 domain-containing protein n=1 Tax=Sphingomonas kyeonggiensis TaxID=1268553 RepID=A0A7W7JXT5_9SPHN|nr:hypothetical protein [Sphingomonas kyeonggiensis]MBB4837308.1 hypothetical protein [Sphingomonas kyeonggiensis]
MKMILMLALAASLSACASFGPRPPTEVSIAKAADRAIGIETGYAVTAELASFGAGALDSATRSKVALGDRAAFEGLTAARLTYPPGDALSPADKVRLMNAVERSNEAHEALQVAIEPPG